MKIKVKVSVLNDEIEPCNLSLLPRAWRELSYTDKSKLIFDYIEANIDWGFEEIEDD